ncbi:hypothetical protein MKW92_040270 [Papaver armeniacum]|nr:hypothetical protein MKW92_040270 [Papaver armeniacum]
MDGGSNARTCWTEETTAYFIQLLQEQVRKCPRGNIMMGNLALRKQAWEHLTSLFVQKYGVHYQTSILKNRFNSLRKKYNDINTLLNNGFQWDRARHLVVADDDNVWNTYIKAHPNARSYRTNSTPLYDDLCVIYGGSPVDDKLNDTGEEEMEDDFSVEIPATDKDTADWIENCLHDEEEAVRQEEEKGEEEDPPFLVRMSRETPAIEENTDDDIENLEEGCSSETFKKHNEDLLSVQKGSTNEGSLKVSVYRSRVTWTTSMDRDFIFLMKNHVQQGNRTKRTFVSEAWMDMVEQLSQKFGPQCDKDALYNRFKTLRKHHSCVQSLLCHDGFEWDETLQMVKGDVHVWDKAYPHSKQYRVSPVPFFKDLCIIFGDTYITGRNNNLGGDPVHNLQEDSSYLNGDIPNQHNKRILKSPLDSRYSEKLKNTDQSVIDVSHEMGSAKLGVVCF